MNQSSRSHRSSPASSPTASVEKLAGLNSSTGSASSGSLELPFLKPLEPLSFPKLLTPQAPTFPSFNETVSPPALSEPPPQQGIFSQLVRDPAYLYQEYLDRPEDFKEDTAELLMSLVSRQKRLEDVTPDEMKKLDEATIELAQHSPKPEKQPDVQESLFRTLLDEDEDDEPEIEWGPNGPVLDMEQPHMPTVPTRWWDKG